MSHRTPSANRYGWKTQGRRPPWEMGIVAMCASVLLNGAFALRKMGEDVQVLLVSREGPVAPPAPDVIHWVLLSGAMASTICILALLVAPVVGITKVPSPRNGSWIAYEILLVLTLVLTVPSWFGAILIACPQVAEFLQR